MITFLTTLLILLCLFIVLLVLLQRTSGGMGSAMGGGAADQMLGAGSGAQLTKMTVWSIVGFFVLAFALYVYYQVETEEGESLQRKGPASVESGPGLNGGISLPPVPAPVSSTNPSEANATTPAPALAPESNASEANASAPLPAGNASAPVPPAAPPPAEEGNASVVPVPAESNATDSPE